MARNTDRKAITTWCKEGLKIHPENQGLFELKTEIEAKKSQQPSVKNADVETTVVNKINKRQRSLNVSNSRILLCKYQSNSLNQGNKENC